MPSTRNSGEIFTLSNYQTASSSEMARLGLIMAACTNQQPSPCPWISTEGVGCAKHGEGPPMTMAHFLLDALVNLGSNIPCVVGGSTRIKTISLAQLAPALPDLVKVLANPAST